MSEYKRFFIQQQRRVGSSYQNVGSTVDTYETYHVVCQESAFKHLPEAKELPSTQWYDEDGDDVYVPPEGTKIDAYDLEITFLYVGTEESMSSDIKQFIEFMYGRNEGGSSEFCYYDEYTGTGRQCCYTKSVEDELFIYNNSDTDALAKFTMVIRVNDPITDWEVEE